MQLTRLPEKVATWREYEIPKKFKKICNIAEYI